MTLIPSPNLQEQGWTQRFTAIGLRLKEAVELYRQLGYEVHLEPADLSAEQLELEACKHCFVTTQARTIYTRPQADRTQEIPGKE
jgi:hypothetical protein